jgi:hypothetical protein
VANFFLSKDNRDDKILYVKRVDAYRIKSFMAHCDNKGQMREFYDMLKDDDTVIHDEELSKLSKTLGEPMTGKQYKLHLKPYTEELPF